jgi:DNA-binding CsgD family transcriptional regulator
LYTTKGCDPFTLLSKREKEIYLLLLSGYKTNEIGVKLNLKPNTISTVIKNLKQKTGTKTLIDLLNIGIKYGHATTNEKFRDYKLIMNESGYYFLQAFEISRYKRNHIIRFEYWVKGQSLFLAEVINGQCSALFAQQNIDF